MGSRISKWLSPCGNRLAVLLFFSMLLKRGICPPWFLALFIAITALQVVGILLILILRPLSQIAPAFSSLGTVSLTATLLALPVFFLTLSGYWSLSPTLGIGVFLTLGALYLLDFSHDIHRWSTRLIPFDAVFKNLSRS